MSDQSTLFPPSPLPRPIPSLPSEQAKKERGKAVAAAKNNPMLETFQQVARALGRERGAVNIDDVRAEVERRGIEYTPGNWMGSIFPASEWLPAGTMTSTHRGGHGRLIRVWRLR